MATLDLSSLRRRLVMGLNRSALRYPDTKTRCLFTFDERPFGVPLKLLGADGFSYDLTQGIYSGYTVSYFGVQVAVYMGFKQIFYLGLDLKNQGDKTHFFDRDFHSRTHDDSEYPRMR